MTHVPALPRWLGLAGLLPQIAAIAAVSIGGGSWRWFALASGWGYAALIFSFLGGMWWGLAAAAQAQNKAVPAWLWFAAVAPSLLALLTFLPWIVGAPWPAPSLLVLGVMLLASLLVDWNLRAIAPLWWMALRIRLSLGLGGLTILLGML